MTSGHANAQRRLAALEEVLKKVPHQYENKSRLRSDVGALLQTCDTLTPQVQTFNGITLFFLTGVVPITYQSSTYNIPVTMYFDPPYPNKGPRCFVTPTSAMVLVPDHPNVDKGGMVSMPYITNWNRGTSTLSETVRQMTVVFARMPPVGATGAGQSRSRPQTAAAASGASHVSQTPVAKATPLAAGAGQVSAAPAGRMPVVQGTLLGPEASARLDVESKLRQRWGVVIQPIVDDTNKQLEMQRQFEGAVEKVDAELDRLKCTSELHEREEAELAAMEVELRDFVDSQSQEEVDVDRLQEQLEPHSAAVLERLSEELALEDLLVALDELLAEKKISIDDFMREMRDASRRQFMCRMERQKAAGLAAAAAAPPVAEVSAVSAEEVSGAAVAGAAMATASPLVAAHAGAPVAARPVARGRVLVAA